MRAGIIMLILALLTMNESSLAQKEDSLFILSVDSVLNYKVDIHCNVPDSEQAYKRDSGFKYEIFLSLKPKSDSISFWMMTCFSLHFIIDVDTIKYCIGGCRGNNPELFKLRRGEIFPLRIDVLIKHPSERPKFRIGLPIIIDSNYTIDDDIYEWIQERTKRKAVVWSNPVLI